MKLQAKERFYFNGKFYDIGAEFEATKEEYEKIKHLVNVLMSPVEEKKTIKVKKEVDK